MLDAERQDAPPRSGSTGLPWLALCFTLIALFTSRITLVLHEFVGHGGLALAIGCRITDFHLFLFGGGWIRYSRSEPFSLAEAVLVSLGGVGLELALGAACIGWGRRQAKRPLVRLVLVCVGLIDLLHAGYYVVVATHYGFGDGRALSVALGAWRDALAVVGTPAVVVLAYFLAGELMRAAAPFFRAKTQTHRMAVLLAAAVIAALAHGTLMTVEQRMVSDESYAGIMKHRSERLVDAELAKLEARRRAEGIAPSQAEMDQAREAFRRRLKPWPLRPVVVIGLFTALLLGAYRTRPASSEPPRRPIALGLWAAACASLALVLVLREPWWAP